MATPSRPPRARTPLAAVPMKLPYRMLPEGAAGQQHAVAGVAGDQVALRRRAGELRRLRAGRVGRGRAADGVGRGARPPQEDAVAAVAAVPRPGRVGADEVGADDVAGRDVARRAVDGDAVAGVGGDDVALTGPAADQIAGAVDNRMPSPWLGRTSPCSSIPISVPITMLSRVPFITIPGPRLPAMVVRRRGSGSASPQSPGPCRGQKNTPPRVAFHLGEADLADGAGVHRVVVGGAGDGDAVPRTFAAITSRVPRVGKMGAASRR